MKNLLLATLLPVKCRHSMFIFRLSEELKKDTPVKSSEVEMQVAELREKCYELETAVQKLQVQNEELQFAYEQECERRQYQEEERFKADQRSR